MVSGIDIFNSIEYLEPKCRKCNVLLEYGKNTKWIEERKVEICLNCGEIIRKE